MTLGALDFVIPLFVPGNRPERFEKAASAGADAIIIDLEDTVAIDAKDQAHASLRANFGTQPIRARTLLRMAGTETPLRVRPRIEVRRPVLNWLYETPGRGMGNAE